MSFPSFSSGYSCMSIFFFILFLMLKSRAPKIHSTHLLYPKSTRIDRSCLTERFHFAAFLVVFVRILWRRTISEGIYMCTQTTKCETSCEQRCWSSKCPNSKMGIENRHDNIFCFNHILCVSIYWLQVFFQAVDASAWHFHIFCRLLAVAHHNLHLQPRIWAAFDSNFS